MGNLLVKCVIAGAVCWGGARLWGAESPGSARVLKHLSADGRTCCAVFLKAGDLPNGIIVRQHVIMVDTSASQVGEHRQQSLAVLASVLKSLPDGDRVRLFAADLRAEPLDDGFHDVRSPAVADAVELLNERVPLGATNLEGVLRTAMQSATESPTDITYIGDGMSTADLVEIPELRTLVADLRRRRMPVHSFGVGGQRNLQLLGILALQTGGYLDFDTQIIDASDDKTITAEKTKPGKLANDIARVRRSSAERAIEQGKGLAAALNAPVFFPTEIQVTPADIVLLPAEALPVRKDRETIYLTRGSLPADARIAMSDAGGETLQWKLSAPLEQPGATFMPVMTSQLEVSGGLTNPLAGMLLFNLAQADFSDNVTAMAQRGAMALQLGDFDQASKLATLAVEADPNNEAARILERAIERAKSSPVKPKPGTAPAKQPK
jgi:hypothetical protein